MSNKKIKSKFKFNPDKITSSLYIIKIHPRSKVHPSLRQLPTHSSSKRPSTSTQAPKTPPFAPIPVLTRVQRLARVLVISEPEVEALLQTSPALEKIPEQEIVMRMMTMRRLLPGVDVAGLVENDLPAFLT
mmetsp:Transcript_11558/g.15744  ORF Transcript_11558/g.15744 Transcript_11558/m.15744 type:complete len:131 (-) Transcript_11558:383-775(-)